MPRRGPPQTPKNTIEQNRKISDRQTIAVTDLLSEGPIYGLVDGQASVFLNDDRAAPLGQAGGSRSRTALRINLTNGSTSATITNGGANPLTVSANGKKYLTIRGGAGTQTVIASNSAAGTDNGAIVTTLTTTGGASFFTDAMVSAPGATPETHVPFRLTRTSALHGVTDEGAGEGVLTTRTNGTTAEFTAGSGAPGGIWVPEGTYTAEVDTVVEVASVNGVTVTLASAWGGTTGSYKFDISGTIVTDSDVVSQTQISTYEGVTTQFRVGTLSQTPFAGEGGVGSTAISNSNPSAGGAIEQSNNFNGSQAPKELIGSSSSGFNLTASQLQEVDEARVVIAYANGFYAVSGKGKNKHTFIRYRFQIAIKKIGSGSFETPITVSPSSHTVHSGLYTNATTFSESFDLNQYRPFADFKIIIDRVDSHENPGFDGVGETFHDWQNVTAASVSNVTCIIKDIVTHPYSAMAKTTFSTKQFQGMPSRTYHLRGLKVQVPSNYVTREEASNGVANYNRDVSTGAITNTYQDWDGAFQLNKVYTNNPAWVFYDILTNNRYGLGDFLKTTDIDKYALFKIARYCDELVDDGKGGTEPRFTANLYFTKQADAYKVLKDMATIFRGMLYFIDGQILPVMDSPAGPIYNFSKANVIEGRFTYETTGSKTRINQVIVSWVNPDANYKAEPLIVEDRQDIVKQNRIISENAVAMGAITEGQALRYGRWKLWTAANQREIVTFSTALNASFLVPGDIINVQDSDRNTLRYSGRVSNTGTRNTSTVPIDSSVTINGSSSYELSVIFVTPGAFATSAVTIDSVAYEKGDLIPKAFLDDGAGGYSLQNIDTLAKSVNAKAAADATENLVLNFGDTTRVEKRTLTNSAGATTSLTVSSAFTTTPDAEAIWGLTEVNSGGDTLAASPKQYKILAMAETAQNTFDITAVEFYNEKFDAVDGDFNTYVADTVYPAVTATDTVPPVQSVFATNQMTNIALGEILELHWIPPTNIGGVPGVYEHLAGFEISHPFIDRENHIRIMDPETTFYGFKDLPIGTHKIAVKVVNVLDNVSEPEIITVTVSDKFDEPIPRTQKGIPYTGDVNAGMQMSNAGVFSFKNPTYTFKHPSTRGKDTVGTSNAFSNSQDCSGMVATSVTTQTTDAGEFLTEHYYLLLDNSETNDKIKLLRYHKPNGVGTPYFYDSIDGSSTTRFGSALDGTFTKAAKASKVTGSGTNFTAQIQQGDVLKLGTEEVEVSAVESNTVLYLAKATDTAHSGVQGFIPNIRIDYINDCIIARAYKDSSDNSFNFVPYAKTDGEVKNAPDVIADGSVNSAQIADNAIGADQINVSLSDLSSGALAAGTTVASGPAAGDDSQKVATTKFVSDSFAPLASPTFTGSVLLPDQTSILPSVSSENYVAGTGNNNLAATTRYVEAAITSLINGAPGTLNTLAELAEGLNDDDDAVTTINTALTNRLRVDVDSQNLSSTQKANALTNLGISAGSGVTSVSGSSPISVTSGATPTVSISAATTSAAGSLSAADKTQLDNLSTNLAAKANLSGATFTGAIAMGNNKITGLGTPTSTTDAATKAYVDSTSSSAASGASGTTYTVSIPSSTTKLRLSGSDSTTDDIEFVGSGATTVTRTNDSKFTISSTDTNTNTQNQYAISCVDGDNSDEEKIRLSGSGHDGSTTDDIVLEAGTGLSIARSGDKITFTNTVTDSNTFRTVKVDTTNNGTADTTLGATEELQLIGGTNVTLAESGGVVTISSTDTNTDTNTQNQYAISCVDGDNSDEEKIRLSGSGHDGNTTDDIVLEAGTGLSIARSGDKITFTNTVTDTNTDTFLGLTDTPGSFTASRFLKVNSSGNAIEFVNNPDSGGTITSVATTAPITGGTVTSGAVTLGINVATTSAKGAMSAADKTKLDIFSVSGVTDIPLDQTFGAIAAKLANFETLNATTANVDFLNANRVISRDIRVGPDDTINATATVADRQYTITTVGNTDFTAIGAESNTVGVLFTATGAGSGTGTVRDYNTVALIGSDGTTLSGKGAHLNSDGDFFVGVHNGSRIFFDQSAGTLTVRGTLNASDISSGTLDANQITVSNLDADDINDISLNNTNNSITIATSTTPNFGSLLVGHTAGGTQVATTSVGFAAGANTTGTTNTAFGSNAGRNVTSGEGNINIGPYTSYSSSANKTGNNNIGIGMSADGSGNASNPVFGGLTSGSNNIAIGKGAGNALTTGSGNVIIGGFSGNAGGLDIRTSSNNIVLSDGDGNVRLHVNSSGTTTFNGDIAHSSNFTIDAGGEIILDADTSGTVRFKDGGTQYASMFKTGTAGLTIDSPGNMIFDSAGDIRLDAAGSDISLLAAGTEFAHLSNSSGDFLIQTAQSDKDIIFKGVDSDASPSTVITALTLDMSNAGAATFNNNITAFSDRRLKDNIKTLDSQKTYQMRGVSYTRDGVPGSGVIAQELEEVAPELVLTNDDGIKSVDYGRTIGYLIETIKDLKKEVEDLKDDIASLRK